MHFSAAVTLVLCLTSCCASADSDTKSWSVEDVVAWAAKEGFDDIAPLITKFSVDGITLLHIDEADLEDELGMSSRLTRKKFMLKVGELKTVYDSDGDGVVADTELPDQDFWQYRALNRKHCDLTTTYLNGSPRVAFLMMVAEGDLGNAEGGLMKWLFPHFWIWANSEEIMEGLPWLMYSNHFSLGIHEVVTAICLVSWIAKPQKTGREAWIRKRDAAAAQMLLGQLFGPAIALPVLTLTNWIIYPIIPWFICDLIFYLSLILPLLAAIIGWVQLNLLQAFAA